MKRALAAIIVGILCLSIFSTLKFASGDISSITSSASSLTTTLPKMRANSYASDPTFPWVGVGVKLSPNGSVQYVSYSDYVYVSHGWMAPNWSSYPLPAQNAFLDPTQNNFTLETNASAFANPPLTQFTYYNSTEDTMSSLFWFQFYPGDLAPGAYSFTGTWQEAAAANPPNYTALYAQRTITLIVTDCWPMFRHDLTHTGYSTSQALTTNHTLWHDTIDPIGTELSSPAVVGGIVYVGSGDTGNVYALDAMTGSRIWNYTTGSLGVASSPAVVGGVVYVGSVEYNYNVYALNATTGAPIWIYPTGDVVESSPAIAGGVVYIGSSDGYIYALNATTGALIWKNEDSGGDSSSPAVVGGVVYVGSDIGHVLALNAATGVKIWNYTTGSNVDSSPAVVGGVVYVGSDDNNVYALNATTGAKMWNYTTGGWVFSSPAVVGGVVYVGSGDRNVYALNSSSGGLIWNFTTGSYVASSPTVAGGVVYVGSEDHKLYALNAATGGLIWSFLTGSLVDTSPTVAQGLVFVTSDDGNIYAFSGFPSSTSVVCSPSLVSAGSHVNCSATVSGSNPTGSVSWSASSSTGYFTQSVCALSSGNCSTTYIDNNTGYVAIMASYSGDSNNLPSSGNATLTVYVNVTTGTNVTVTPTDNLELTFANVTVAGTVVANATPTVQAPNLDLVGPYYNIKVTMSFSGNATVSLAFDGSNMTDEQKSNLTMMQYTPIPGDVQPPFGIVNMRDVAYIARHFGTNPTSPNWDPAADINGDGKVDMKDIALVARHFGFTASWVNITAYVDTTNNIVYGTTTHFSFIGIH